MRRAPVLAAALCTALAGPLAADERPIVVELYTSQGCSSCPPADRMLRELGEDADVIPLALHVDYWDYIGWKDSFAQPRFTARQKGYARAAGRSSIYTPQMVVNGTDDIVGNRPKDLKRTVAQHRARTTPVEIEVERRGEVLHLSLETETPVAASKIYLVRYAPSETVAIRRGENAGRKIEYTHIVTDWDVIGHWDGASAHHAEIAIEGDAPAVVLVQVEGYGEVLAAARLR
ncbi:DUF1223 domain-containing protein [Roseivivax sediminis]|uniref:DUF1223 domain-containing protein n=1 Tax=Roseivivax sediminis TaxID=936889 RepID=A0A1I1Y5M1_9RHOB|nr:DUF1223 domain-containing protein [Roseivivax sediminis]SFE14856.1 hypothetical protein SAMN04515678_106298 [Roseivivax sediminis]